MGGGGGGLVWVGMRGPVSFCDRNGGRAGGRTCAQGRNKDVPNQTIDGK